MDETKTLDGLISRRAAIEAVTLFSGNDAITAIRAIPSAQSDLSEYSDKLWRRAYERGKEEAVIRCKDCRWGYASTSATGDTYQRCVMSGAHVRQANDFCSRAERREDG